jgi:hypothetical protein
MRRQMKESAAIDHMKTYIDRALCAVASLLLSFLIAYITYGTLDPIAQ